MKLYSNPASPFARKARVIVHELDIALTVIDIAARGNMEYRRVNPLGKIPALGLDDGAVLFDSAVICEYLDRAGGGGFFPRDGDRWRALMLQALGDGVMEAALARVYEDRYRPAAQHNAEIVTYLLGTVDSALDALEHVSFAQAPTIGEIAVGCALGYLDFRLAALDWREGRPKLAAWYEGFAHRPAMLATRPQ